jgi:hypothetical protein
VLQDTDKNRVDELHWVSTTDIDKYYYY